MTASFKTGITGHVFRLKSMIMWTISHADDYCWREQPRLCLSGCAFPRRVASRLSCCLSQPVWLIARSHLWAINPGPPLCCLLHCWPHRQLLLSTGCSMVVFPLPELCVHSKIHGKYREVNTKAKIRNHWHSGLLRDSHCKCFEMFPSQSLILGRI